MRHSLLAFRLIVIAVFYAQLHACQSPKSVTDPSADQSCFGFDQRQCQEDSFASYIEGNSPEQLHQGISDYLNDQSITVHHIRIDQNFHEFVCEACGVCPEHHRFFIRISSEDADKLSELGLFNIESVDCSKVF